jgi:hypothetical protein
MRQCDAIRQLIRRHGLKKHTVIGALEHGLQRGGIRWKSNSHGWTALQYASALWSNYVERARL